MTAEQVFICCPHLCCKLMQQISADGVGGGMEVIYLSQRWLMEIYLPLIQRAWRLFYWLQAVQATVADTSLLKCVSVCVRGK